MLARAKNCAARRRSRPPSERSGGIGWNDGRAAAAGLTREQFENKIVERVQSLGLH